MILPSWMKIRVAFFTTREAIRRSSGCFLLHAVRSCTVCCFPFVIEGFLFKTVGDWSLEFFGVWFRLGY